MNNRTFEYRIKTYIWALIYLSYFDFLIEEIFNLINIKNTNPDNYANSLSVSDRKGDNVKKIYYVDSLLKKT